ncbi:MAG: acetylornithine deacetylase [Gammaproteobacteria bacterium]|nr:acetylornithine deacetylase [Gammaproteobacteria bacterium]
MKTPDCIDMIEQLIAIPSISSINSRWDQPNLGVVELLAEWLEPLGFNIEISPLDGRPGKANLIATAGSGDQGLVLSGHTDTVPYDEGRWSHDPFKLTRQDGRLYGLGTSDMKGFFALVIEALRELDLGNLTQPLSIIATADEESSMGGAKALVAEGRRLGRHALIGEPTGLKPIRMHKGISMETIRLLGRSGHSSDPSLGVSALEGMHRVMGEILRWRKELQQNHRNPMFKVEVPTVNLGRIQGGDNPNRICAECELQIDIRPLPGMELQGLRSELTARLQELLKDNELKLEMETNFEGIPPMETAATAEIIRVAEELSGEPAISASFGTEGPYLHQLGMETVILGPGDIDQAHQPDEYLGIDRIDPMIKILQGMIKRFCLT